MNRSLSYKLSILVFTLPALILFSVVVCYPILNTFHTSLYDWDGVNFSFAKFVGIDNYVTLFQDPDFFKASNNGLMFAAVLVVYQLGLGTLFALLLSNKDLRAKRFFKTAYFIPVVLSVAVVCLLWLSIFNPEHGLLNKLFQVLGISYQQAWLSDMNISILAVAFVNAWQYMGIQLVLIYAAIKSIPEHYYEAATIDGASTAKAHWYVTFPLLAETYKFCLVIAITGGLKAFEQMYIMTGGGPGTATYTITYHMYSAAFRSNEYGYACSSAILLVVQCLLFTVLINKFIARERIVY